MRYVPIRQQRHLRVRVHDWKTRATIVLTDMHHRNVFWWMGDVWRGDRWERPIGLTQRMALIIVAVKYGGLTFGAAVRSLVARDGSLTLAIGPGYTDGGTYEHRFSVWTCWDDRYGINERQRWKERRIRWLNKFATCPGVRYVPHRR